MALPPRTGWLGLNTGSSSASSSSSSSTSSTAGVPDTLSDQGPFPVSFIARVLNRYEVSLVNPVIVIGLSVVFVLIVTHVEPLSVEYCQVYDVIGLPPSSGAV